ncbi:MAG: hypothetical protein IJW40_00105 [Clostridia bacterium]|nr:hypothetical protein [Clostridia bacterium]
MKSNLPHLFRRSRISSRSDFILRKRDFFRQRRISLKKALLSQCFFYGVGDGMFGGVGAMLQHEIVLRTMKSEHARMKSSAKASDEIKSASPIPTKSDFIAKRFHPA